MKNSFANAFDKFRGWNSAVEQSHCQNNCKEFKNKKQLLKLKDNTEKMVVYLLQNVDSTLEKYTIGARHLGDRDLDFEEMD